MGILSGVGGIAIGAIILIVAFWLIGSNAVNFFNDGIAQDSANGAIWAIIWIIVGIIMLPIGFYLLILLGIIGFAND